MVTAPGSGRPGNTPRPLDAKTRDEWLQAASQRVPPRPRDTMTLRNFLQARNARKYRKLTELMRWAERELATLGMNPEDARWVLP